MAERKQLFNISVEDQCSTCDHGSAIGQGEYLCDKKCDELLYPEPRGTERCLYFYCSGDDD